MAVSLIPASKVEFDRLIDICNAVYVDYFVPIHVDQTAMRHIVEQFDVDLAASRLAVDQGELVGVGMLAKRGRRGWITWMGIVPAFRRQGIGRQIVSALLDEARAAGLERAGLEVITENTAAHRLYLDMGFKTLRRLLILECQQPPAPAAAGITVETVTSGAALVYYDRFHTVANPWQRERDSIAAAGDTVTGWLARRGAQVAAYVIGWASAGTVYMLDAACAPGEQRALQDLVGQLHRDRPLASGRLVNLGEDDPVWPALAEIGYAETLSQYEMAITL